MKLNCIHADTCLSDYWGGHHLPHVSIFVTGRKMKLSDIRDAIRNELRDGAVCGSNDDARLLSADMVREIEEKRANALTRAAYAAVRRDIKGKAKGQRVIDTGCDFADDDDYSEVRMYFVFKEVEA